MYLGGMPVYPAPATTNTGSSLCEAGNSWHWSTTHQAGLKELLPSFHCNTTSKKTRMWGWVSSTEQVIISCWLSVILLSAWDRWWCSIFQIIMLNQIHEQTVRILDEWLTVKSSKLLTLQHRAASAEPREHRTVRRDQQCFTIRNMWTGAVCKESQL